MTGDVGSTPARIDRFLAELAREDCAAVLIDDTGIPGLQDTPAHLHPDRKSWVAVVVPRDRGPHLVEHFGAIVRHLHSLGISEFHFSDVFQGVGEFADVELKHRIFSFELFVRLFEYYEFPILVQTLDPTFLDEHPAFAELKIPPFRLSDHTHLALLLLLLRVRDYLRTAWPEERARVYVDEGFQDAGKSLRIPTTAPQFKDERIYFEDSSVLSLLQLADFAAFGMNRSQLLLGRESLSKGDHKLVEILNGIAFNYINLDQRPIDLDGWKPIAE